MITTLAMMLVLEAVALSMGVFQASACKSHSVISTAAWCQRQCWHLGVLSCSHLCPLRNWYPVALHLLCLQKLIFAGAIATLVKLLSSTAPAVQEHAAGALCNLAVDDQNVPLIADTVGARLLVQMLGSGTGSVLELSAQLIQDMSRVPQFREATVAFGVIPALASVLRDRAPDGAVAECAAGALASVTTDAGCARAFAAEPSAASSLVRLLVANSAACHSSGRNNSSSVGSSPGCNALTLEYALIALSHICEYADSSQVISSTPGAIEAVTSLLSSSSCNLQLAAAAVISSIASVQANCHALAASGAIDHLMLLLAGCCCSSSGSGDSTDVTISQKQVVEPASTTGRQPAAAQEQCINTALPVQQQQQQQQCIGIAVPDNGKLLTMKTQVPTLQAATHPHSTAMTPFLETGYSNNAAMRAAAVAAAANATTSGSSHHRTMIAPVSHLAAAVDDNVMSTFASFAEWQPNQSQSPSASGTPGVQNSSSSGSRGTPSGTSGDKKPTRTSGTPSNKLHCASGTPFETIDGAKRYEKAKTSRVRQQAVVDSERSSKKGAKGRYVCEVRRESCEQEWLCPMNSVTSLVNASPR